MKQVQIDHFTNFKMPNSLKSNKKGILSFLIKQGRLEENRYDSDLYILEKKDNTVRRLTATKDVKAYYWLNDEEIVFPCMREEKDKETAKKGLPLTVFYKISAVRSGEAEEFLRLNYAVTNLFFLEEDRFLFTAKYDHRVERLLAENDGNTEKAAKALAEDNDYHVFDEIPFWSNGAGVTNKQRSRLYLYDKGEITALTDEYTSVGNVQLAPCKSFALFTCKRYTDKMPTFNRLMALDLQSLAIRDVSLEEGFTHGSYVITGKDTILLHGNDQKTYGLNQNGLFYNYNFNQRSWEMLDESYQYSGHNSVGSDVVTSAGFDWVADDGALYFSETMDDSSHILSLNLSTKEIVPVTKEKGMLQEFVYEDGTFYATALRGLDGSELYAIKKDGSETRLTSFNTALSQEYSLSAPKELFFENSEGTTIHGWVMKPVGMEAGKKYPVILDIHGGPKTVYGPNFFHEMQYWANNGYAVIFCNPTGGDGKGAKFADIRGKYGTIDYEDIMQFVDVALAQNDFLDGSRMGVTGGSYGGFMTNWIIGHTNRFKAAASQRSISNWISKSNTTDIGYYFNQDQNASNTWDNHDKLWWHSPLKYADKCTTPTLFIHSDEDYRCWMAEGIQMFTALKYFGVDARLCLFKGENHELSRSGLPKHRVRRLDEITKWFDHYLKGIN